VNPGFCGKMEVTRVSAWVTFAYH